MVDKSKFAEEDAQGYRVSVIGRNVEVSEGMKNYVIDKLSKMDRFHTHVMDVHVTLEIQKLEHIVTIFIKFEHFNIKVHADSTDMYVSIDKAVDRLMTKLSRWKSRIQDHHKRVGPVADMEKIQIRVLQRPYDELAEINEEIDFETKQKQMAGILPAKIIGMETHPLKTLTLDEAVMKMELSGEEFFLFRSEEDHKLKVIYRRADGNYGIMQSE